MNDLDQQLRDAGGRLRASAPTPAATETALQSLGDVPLENDHGSRRRMWIVGPAVLAAAAAAIGIIVLTRPTDDAIAPAETTLPTAPTVTPTVAPTVVVPPSVAPTVTPTDPPSTTSTPTTAPPPATPSWTGARLPGWVPGVPCCGANPIGTPSPASTAVGEPLADGVYPFAVREWSPSDPERLVIGVRRFVPCADGVDDCVPSEGSVPFAADEVGVAADERLIELTLDGSITAYLQALEQGAVPDDIGNLPTAVGRTDGVGLAELLGALGAAYDAEVGDRIAAGIAPDEIVGDLQADPRNGFTAADPMNGLLTFTDGDAPAILFQTITGDNSIYGFQNTGEFDQQRPLPRSGTSALLPVGLEVRDGALSLAFYAGFRS